MKFRNYLINRYYSDIDYKEILKGSGTTFTLKIIGLVFSYSFNIYFARVYGAEVMGLFALAITVSGIFSLFAQMGTQTSILRFVAQYAGQGNFSGIKEVYKKTLHWVIPLSIFFSTLFYFLSSFIADNIFHKPLLSAPFKITAFVLPFSVLMGVNTASLRGLKKIKDAFIFSTILPPALNMVGLMVLTHFIFKSYLTPIYVNLLTAFIGAIYSLLLWGKQSAKLPANKQDSEKILDTKEIVKVSMPMFMTSAMLLIMGMTDIFMLGMFRTSAEVGVYRVALRLALFTSFTLSAVNSIAGPKFSELYWNGERDKLMNVAKFGSKITFWIALPIFIITVIFARQILSIFGDEFIIGTGSLIILCTGQLFSASCGSVGIMLDMTGKQKILRNALIVAALFNVLLNFLLIQKYGIMGAALGTAVSAVIWNVISSMSVYKIYGNWIGYYPTFSKIK